MDRNEILKSIMQKKGMKVSDVAREANVPYTSVKSIFERSIEKASYINICKICAALGISADELEDMAKADAVKQPQFSSEDIHLLDMFHSLDELGRKHILYELDHETTRVTALSKLERRQTTVIDFDGQQNVPTRYIQYYQKVSAGTGELIYEDTPPEQIAIPDIPKFRRVAYAVKVSGHSMETTYYDGDLLLIEPACIVDVGEIGIFNVDEKAYVKKRGETELISLNEGYKNVPLTNEARCMGRVVDRYVAD